eukprot:6208196-Pleurochrysis_carterae.AAC.5
MASIPGRKSSAWMHSSARMSTRTARESAAAFAGPHGCEAVSDATLRGGLDDNLPLASTPMPSL